MESDQLEEYRRMAQSRHAQRVSRKDAALAQKLQEDEQRKLKEQARRDEEIAQKLQAQCPPPADFSSSQAYPSRDVASAQTFSGQSYTGQQPSAYSAYYPPQRQPPVQPYYQSPPSSQAVQQPLLQRGTASFLPTVTDKCCGVNTQTCVLATAGVLTASVVVPLAFLLIS